jgi:hypothetical protein
MNRQGFVVKKEIFDQLINSLISSHQLIKMCQNQCHFAYYGPWHLIVPSIGCNSKTRDFHRLCHGSGRLVGARLPSRHERQLTILAGEGGAFFRSFLRSPFLL